MNALLLWLKMPEWKEVIEALLHSLWQAGVVALLLGLVLRRVVSPIWRYRLALGSLGGVLLTAILTWAVLNQRSTTHIGQPDISAQALVASVQPDHRSETSEKVIVSVTPNRKQSVTARTTNWIAWMALGWLMGALMMLARAGIQVAGAEQLRRSGRPLADARIAQLLAEAQRAAGLARTIRVVVTDMLTSPAVVGVLVPTLILPLSLMTTLTHEQLRFVLLHELAHIRRGDYFANLFQLFVEALLFFNPAVWWISRQVRREREACCDALAIELSGAPADYARTLVQVAENALIPSPAAASAFGDKQAGPSSLSDRVQRLLVPGYRPTLRLTWRAMLISLVAGGTLLVLSALGTRTTVGAILADNRDSGSNTGIPKTNGAAQILSAKLPPPARTNAAALVQNARLLLEAGKPDEAEAKLKAALDMDPENPAAYYYLSHIKESRIRNAKGGQVIEVNRDWSERKQTPAGILYSRRFKVDPYTFEQSLGIQWVDGEWWFPSKTNRHEGFIEAVQALFAKVGVELEPPKTIWYKNRSGELFIRATEADLDRLTPFLAQYDNRTPPNSNSRSEPSNLPAPPPQDARITAEVVESPFSPKQSGLRQLTNAVSVLGELPLIGKLFRSGSNGPSTAVQDSDQLHTRRYKVDPNTFTKNLAGITAHTPAPTNVLSVACEFFSSFGVKLEPPKNVYFNDSAGELLVRATLKDLDTLEEVLQVLNAQAMQVNLKVRFIEVDSQNGFDWLIGNMLLAATNSFKDGFSQQFSGILTEPQYRVVLRVMEERKDAKVLAMQEVTTSSGRQAQMQTVELKTVVNGMDLPLPALPGHTITNASTNPSYQTQVLPFGPVLNVIPYVAADGHTIQMTLLPTVTEFLGYDDPGKVLPGSRNRKREGELPLPRVRVRQMSMSANVWDGQTLILGTASEEILAKKTDGSVERNASRDAKKQLLIFITPTIIDQGGNRMSAGDKLPTERTNLPLTPKK